MFFSLLTSVGAQASNEVDQGIIPALSDASSVSESTLDEHLQEMGFDTTEISTLAIEMKRDISSKDGKKVAAQELATTVTITDEIK